MKFLGEINNDLLFHQTKTKRTLCSNGYFNRSVSTQYFLSLPDIIFKFNFSQNKHYYWQNDNAQSLFTGLNLAFSNQNLTTLYHPAFPNVMQTGVCLGYFHLDHIKSKKEFCEKLINDFWQSTFTDSLLGFKQYHHKPLDNFSSWQEKTKENPNWTPDQELIPLENNLNFLFLPLNKLK